jgi:cell division protein FtsI (penicillin-binding protein 3)
MAVRRGSRRAAGTAADGRVRLLRLGLLLCFLAIATRALWLTASSSGLTAMAQRQHERTVALPAHRGDILDRGGLVLAVGKEARTVYATPRELKDPLQAAGELARVLQLKAEPLARLLEDRNSWYACVARQIDPAQAKAAVALDIPGVGSVPEEKRQYPMHRLAAQVLGYAGVDNKGLAGLEARYEKELAGKPGSEIVACDPSGRILKTVRASEPVTGKSLRLTIDSDIQFTAERVLGDTVRRFHAKAGVAIVMDPRDGEILAMANVPTVDANAYGKDLEHARNRAVTDTFEPGSIFKVVTVAAALEEGLVKPDTTFRLKPQITVGERTIHEAHVRGTETFTVKRILSESSNVGAATLGVKLGRERLQQWLDRFGLGRPTGVGFPYEAAGILPGFWSESTTGTVPMGQGVSVTALQMAAVYAAIANGGVLVRPRLVAQVGDQVVAPDEGTRVISAKVAGQVLAMMNDAVMEGTGRQFQIAGYKAAGKTGTAQKPDPKRGGYALGKYVASFVGVVPSDDPRLVVLVSIDEPSGAIYGGTVAAPAAHDIAVFTLQHLKIAP